METWFPEKPAPERAQTAKAAQGAASQREIVAAAMRLISRQGFHRTSMSQIAAEAGLTKGALYWHYRSKEDLGRAVLDHVRSEFADRVITQVRAAEGPLERLDVLIGAHLRLMHGGGIHCGAVQRMQGEIGSYEPEFADELRQFIDDWAAVVVRLLGRGKQQGVVRPDLDERAAARVVIAAVSGAHVHGRLLQSPEQFEELIAEVQRFVRRSVAAG
jgi:AcrR family transcriptional regulator